MNIIKKIINTFKDYIEVHNDDLSFLDVGDIILAKRYRSDAEKNKIKEGHRQSPYVIISKEKGKTIALQCTSNPHSDIKWKDVFYPLNRLIYNLDKNCFINTTRSYQLKDIQYIKKLGHLTEYDLNKLIKYLHIIVNSNYKYKPRIDLKKLKFNYEIGDIILYNDEKYYIYEMDSKNYLTYKLNKKLKLNNRLLINNTYYSFQFSQTEIIKRKSDIILVETFNSSEIELINAFKDKKMVKKVNDNTSIDYIGALVEYHDNYYYVKDETEEYFIAFRVYISQNKVNNMALIKIRNGNFYTYFNEAKLLKNKKYKIRRKASLAEIKYNENIFELSKKSRAEAKKKMLKTRECILSDGTEYFIPKTIIVNKITCKNYLILSRENDILELVNIDDLSDYFYFCLGDDNGPYEYGRIITEEEFLEYKKKINELQQLASLLTIN